MFTFSAGEAYRIRNGRVEELCRPVMLSGNVFTTLHNIDGIANDLGMNEGGRLRQGRPEPTACVQRQPAHSDPPMPDRRSVAIASDTRTVTERILERAAAVADQAEVFHVASASTPVKFEANQVKAVDSNEAVGAAVRIIKDGRVGFASTSNLDDIDDLVAAAEGDRSVRRRGGLPVPWRRRLPRRACVR